MNALLMGCCFALLALCACGGSSNSDSSSAGLATDAGSELVVWSCFSRDKDAGIAPDGSRPPVLYCAPENESPTKICDAARELNCVKSTSKQPVLCPQEFSLCAGPQ